MRGELVTSLAAAPRMLERLLRVFPADRLDDKIPGAQLTPRQTVASLAASETLVLERIRLANTHPGSAVDSIDAFQLALQNKNAKDIFLEAEVFESRRLMTVEYLQSLHDLDWSKTLILSGIAVTLGDYVGLILSNDLMHLDEMTRPLAAEVATIS